MTTTLEAKRSGQFGKGRLISNVVAGVIVGVVSPLGGSWVQIARPTSAFIAILAGVAASNSGDYLMLEPDRSTFLLFFHRPFKF